jgi:hypothetical protein
MKKTTYKTILMLLIYALALNPISVVLADQSGGSLSNIATKHCKMEDKAHKSAMKMDDASSSMKMADKADCKCKKDCQQGACGQQCADCGHFFVGLPTISTEQIHNHSALINIIPDLRHQQPMLVHYRPPKTLHS